MAKGTSLNLTHMVRPAVGGTGGEPAPGLLLLHGIGADEADLMGLEGALDPRLTIISARAPFGWGPGFAWYAMYVVGQPDAQTMHASIEELREFMEGIIPAYDIDPERLFMMGFSQGAIMSATMCLLYPERVRGVVMHSGYIPDKMGLDLKPDKLHGKGFFVAHGIYDDVIPVSFGRAANEYLSATGARLTYREYPIGHTISEESLYDLSEWLTNEVDESGVRGQ